MALLGILLIYFLGPQLTPDVTGAIINEALNKPANMSSLHRSPFFAENAVDGNKSTVPDNIMHTAGGQSSAWWKVDLQTVVWGARVKIYFRTDTDNTMSQNRRNGVQLYTSTTPFSSYPGGQSCHTFTGTVPDVVSVNCTGPWRHLLVYKSATKAILDFAEVEVLVCSNGTYGTDCTKPCASRQCVESSSSCDRYTGACSSQGCKAGWWGTDCTAICTTDTYGHNCNKNCASRKCVEQSSTCDRFKGTCSSAGCIAGYQGTDCTQECTAEAYGPECSMTCDDRKCNASSSPCDHVLGQCFGGCMTGWNGTDCTTVCSTGTYGINCDQLCSKRHCVTSSGSCDHVNGACADGCGPGWNGTDCMLECPNGSYGSNCVKSCSDRQCTTPSSSCDRETGQCSDGCLDGWKGKDCTSKCAEGTFGQGCMSCSERHCQGESDCPGDDGTCSGGCQDGWKLRNCTQACPSGTYGPDCNSLCGNCTGDEICDPETGNCPSLCKPGWQGRDCKMVMRIVDEESALIPAVAGAVAAILVIAIIVIVVIIFRRRRRAASTKNHQPNGIQSTLTMDNVNVYENVELGDGKKQKPLPRPTKESKPKVIAEPEQEEEVLEEDEPSPDRDYYNDSEDVLGEIPVEDLADVVQKIKQRKVGFEAEYNRLPSRFTASYEDSQKAENAGKNKFRGYYPYDHNRIRLSALPDVPGSDYINASRMHSHNQKKTYIAAQAPNKKTVGDFWRMIWEKRCQRVIMLTGLVEDMKAKCYQYWPTKGPMDTDHFKIEVNATDTRAHFTIRHIKAKSKQSGECRSVVQYHFTSWPDHGVPDTLALVHFIWMIRQPDTSGDGPLLVHCSAGIGRTGTYIAVDSLLDQAREDGVVDVLGYVSEMRGQRKNMIQTKEQYECVFHCLVEMTKFGNTSMNVDNFTTSYSSRGMDSMTDRKTLRELTQMMITEERNDNPDRHRMWVNGNQDYIVRVGPTLRQRRGYMMSVVPPPALEKLLWKLVEENNVQNIIVISQLQMDLVGSKGSTKKYGDIKVTTTGQTNLTPELTLVNQKLQVMNEENSTNLKFFKFDCSPTMDSMSSCLLYHAHLQHLSGEATPVVIIHSETDRKCAVWLCIMGNILSGILEDRRVDVIGHVRTFLRCCPDLPCTKEDVEKLHEFAQTCVQMTETSNTYANM